MYIFLDEGEIQRVGLKDQPEIWGALFNITNPSDQIDVKNLGWILSLNDRKNYLEKELNTDGNVYNYIWEDKSKNEIWKGKVIGNPLLSITDKNELKNKILKPLLE